MKIYFNLFRLDKISCIHLYIVSFPIIISYSSSFWHNEYLFLNCHFPYTEYSVHRMTVLKTFLMCARCYKIKMMLWIFSGFCILTEADLYFNNLPGFLLSPKSLLNKSAYKKAQQSLWCFSLEGKKPYVQIHVQFLLPFIEFLSLAPLSLNENVWTVLWFYLPDRNNLFET